MCFIEDISKNIESIVENSNIEEYLSKCLEKVVTPDDLVRFFHRFSQYNQHFPGAVSYLVSAIHFKSDLFKDEKCEVLPNSDISSSIASSIFFAAEDEYALGDRKKRLTHRMMAQNVLNHAIEYAGWSSSKINEYDSMFSDNEKIFNMLCNGYRVDKINDIESIFLAIGFHLGSERLADIEFNLVDKMLKTNHPSFVHSARKNSCNGYSVPIYSWISIHTAVEVDHFKYGLLAASDAIRYCTDKSKSSNHLMSLLSCGFMEFIDFQKEMFYFLKNENHNEK